MVRCCCTCTACCRARLHCPTYRLPCAPLLLCMMCATPCATYTTAATVSDAMLSALPSGCNWIDNPATNYTFEQVRTASWQRCCMAWHSDREAVISSLDRRVGQGRNSHATPTHTTSGRTLRTCNLPVPRQLARRCGHCRETATSLPAARAVLLQRPLSGWL